MMDIWHCHKPDPPKDEPSDEVVAEFREVNPRNETEKGYGAANRVVCSPGTVLIDIASFVFAESDCRGVQKVRVYSSWLLPDFRRLSSQAARVLFHLISCVNG
jgi:hypothetical protein